MKKTLAFGVLFASLLFALNTNLVQAAFQRNLSVGLKGDSDVKALQNLLKDEGYFTGTATGNFGPVTKRAVQAFQAANNISPTGFVGPLTRATLSDSAPDVVSTPSTGSSPTSNPPVTSSTPSTATQQSGSLSASLLFTNSSASQFVPVGNSGASDATKAAYQFTSTGGAAT